MIKKKYVHVYMSNLLRSETIITMSGLEAGQNTITTTTNTNTIIIIIFYDHDYYFYE